MSYIQLEQHLKTISHKIPFNQSNVSISKKRKNIQHQFKYFCMILDQIKEPFQHINHNSKIKKNEIINMMKQYLESPSIHLFINNFFYNIIENEIEFRSIKEKVMKKIKLLLFYDGIYRHIGISLLIQLSKYCINSSREIYYELFKLRDPICKDILYETHRINERIKSLHTSSYSPSFSPLNQNKNEQYKKIYVDRLKRFEKYQLCLIHNLFFEITYINTISSTDTTMTDTNIETNIETRTKKFIHHLISNEKSVKYGFIFKEVAKIFLTKDLDNRNKIFRKFLQTF